MEYRVKKQKVTRTPSSKSLKKNLIRRKVKKSEDPNQKKLIDSKIPNHQQNIK